MRGDKFGLAIPMGEPAGGVPPLQTVRDAISRPIGSSQVIEISANAGLVMAPRDGTVREDSMSSLEPALRFARRRGRGLALSFSLSMEGDFDERRFIKRELCARWAAPSFECAHQPIVSADGGQLWLGGKHCCAESIRAGAIFRLPYWCAWRKKPG